MCKDRRRLIGEEMFCPLVSVVVPIYNVEPYLERCLNSIVEQTYKNLEIILVDDGSQDNCPRICDEWRQKDSRINVIHKPNEGLGMARNTGIENAHGDFIFFFDSDDYVAINTVEKCLLKAQTTKSDAVIFSRNEVFPDGRIERIIGKFPQDIYQADQIANILLPGLYTYRFGFGISAWSKMFSLSVIRKYNLKFYSERDVISEDAVFCLDYFSKSSRCVLMEDNLYYYYKNEKSLSRKYIPQRQLKNNDFLIKSKEKITELELPNVVLNHVEARYQMYSLAAMKQIVVSNLSLREKKIELRKIYNDKVLRDTIRPKVLVLSKLSVALFFIVLKLKCYYLCDGLLMYKNK